MQYNDLSSKKKLDIGLIFHVPDHVLVEDSKSIFFWGKK